jgi:hypothetical protein
VTVGSSYHLHKIAQRVLLVKVTEKMELTNRSSTCSPENLASDPETWQESQVWQHCQTIELKNTLVHKMMHPQRMQ